MQALTKAVEGSAIVKEDTLLENTPQLARISFFRSWPPRSAPDTPPLRLSADARRRMKKYSLLAARQNGVIHDRYGNRLSGQR